jgi:PAS domain S-box-containing protein
MNVPGVDQTQAINRMIADLSEISASGPSTGLGFFERCSILEKLRTRIESEPARVITDTEGRITAINPAFTELCGHCFDDLKGRKPGSILQGPMSSAKSVAALRKAIQNREPVTTELVNYHKDRSTYRVRIELKPLFAPAGDLTGYEAREWKLE